VAGFAHWLETEDCGWVDYVQWTGSAPSENQTWDETTYTYDPSGRRIEKNVDGYKTRYVYDGGNVIAEYDDNNNLTRKYIHGARVDELVCMIDVSDNNAAYYYHYDALGSVVALSNSSGDSCQSYEYSAYGQVAVEYPEFKANPYMFTGRRFDYETGLYYYRARYYNPYIGRFLQTDPIGYSAGMNLYAYCRNNPLVLTDPSGCDPFDSNDANDANDSGYVDPLKQFSAGEYTWWEYTDGTDAVPLSEAPPTLAASMAVTWALSQLGNEDYGFEGKVDNFPKKKWKCNKFVRDAYVKGADVDYPHYKRNLRMRILRQPAWPINANDLANPDFTGDNVPGLDSYPVLDGGSLKVGDIVSFSSGGEGLGHTSIYIGNGQIIQAGPKDVKITKITARQGYEDMVVRRYQP